MGDIKTRFKLEGEQTYRKAMTDAAAVVKALNSEQKLAEAQYKATGDAQKYAEEQTRILNEQIAEQQKAVKAAEEAVAELTRNGVEPNSRQMLTWRTRLNNARTTLQNMETRLSSVSSELDDQSDALDDAADAAAGYQTEMEKVARGVNLQNTRAAIDGITSGLEGITRAAASALKGLWNLAGDAGDWADGIITASSEMGVDPETYQSWLYASRFIDTSVTDIQKSWQDIQKNMDTDSKHYLDYLAMLGKMGINTMATATEMRSSQDIFWDMIDYLHGIGDEAKRAEEATKLFGSDWRKLNPLIEAGSAAYMEYAEQGREVAVVSNEQVAALGAQDDAMEDLEARLQKLKMDLLSQLAPAFTAAAEAISAAVTALDNFVQSEEGQEALSALNEAIQGIIDSFLGEDNGKESFEKLVNKAKDAITAFTSAMTWISENGDTVKNVLIGWGVALGALKVGSGVLNLLTLLNATPLSKLTTVFGGAANGEAGAAGAGAAGAGAAGAGAAGAGAAAGKAGASGAGTSAAKVAGATVSNAAFDAAAGIGIVGVYAAVLAGAVADDQKNREDWREAHEDAAALIEEATERAEAKGATGDQNVDLIRVATTARATADYNDYLDPFILNATLENLYAMNDGTALSPRTQLRLRKNHNEDLMPEDREALLGEVIDDAMDSMGRPWGQITAEERAADIASSMEDINAVLTNLDEAETPESIGAMRDLINDLVYHEGVFDALSDKTKDMWGELLDPSKGLDLYDERGTAFAKELLGNIYADLEADQNRPVEDGKAIAEGFAEGIEDNADEASDAASDMADDTIAAAEDALGIQSPSRVFHGIGENVAVGLANGIYDRGDDAIRAALWLAESVENIVRSALQIHSPSQVFEQLGTFTGLGFAEGIRGTADEVDRAVSAMIGATARRPALTVGGVMLEDGETVTRRSSSDDQTDAPGYAQVTIMVDGEELGEVMVPIINRKIGAKIQATKR